MYPDLVTIVQPLDIAPDTVLPLEQPKEVFHIISFEPISEKMTSKSFHDPGVKSVILGDT